MHKEDCGGLATSDSHSAFRVLSDMGNLYPCVMACANASTSLTGIFRVTVLCSVPKHGHSKNPCQRSGSISACHHTRVQIPHVREHAECRVRIGSRQSATVLFVQWNRSSTHPIPEPSDHGHALPACG